MLLDGLNGNQFYTQYVSMALWEVWESAPPTTQNKMDGWICTNLFSIFFNWLSQLDLLGIFEK